MSGTDSLGRIRHTVARATACHPAQVGSVAKFHGGRLAREPVLHRTYSNYVFIPLCRLFSPRRAKIIYKRRKVPCCRRLELLLGTSYSSILVRTYETCMSS